MTFNGTRITKPLLFSHDLTVASVCFLLVALAFLSSGCRSPVEERERKELMSMVWDSADPDDRLSAIERLGEMGAWADLCTLVEEMAPPGGKEYDELTFVVILELLALRNEKSLDRLFLVAERLNRYYDRFEPIAGEDVTILNTVYEWHNNVNGRAK